MGKTQARRKTAAKPKVTAKPKSSPVKKASAKTVGAKKIAAKKKEADTPFITTLTIENFKSIKSLKLNPKRVNVFIGEPNSGKTNILEALSLLSEDNLHKGYFNHILRIERAKQLFCEQNSKNTIRIQTNKNKYLIFEDKYNTSNSFPLFNYLLADNQTSSYLSKEIQNTLDISYTHFGNTNVLGDSFKHNSGFRTNVNYYIYNSTQELSDSTNEVLNQPHGSNIIHVLKSNSELAKLVALYLEEQNRKLGVYEEQQRLEIISEKNGLLYSYTYLSLSETLRRYFFLEAILKSNNQNVILLDEPDTHAFPPYVKQFAEEIAFQKSNQFFITTHNPYMLGSLVEKTPTKELAVFICRKENNQTKVYELNEKQILQVMDYDVDVFFNLDRIIGL
ncbi:MAG: AAA family ATPase [Bacteroidota bacterium]|jgi:AAA15 family ATPase/GTPase